MKKKLATLAAAFLACSMTMTASAKTLKVAYSSDPVGLDIYMQLSGGMLRYANLVFDPLVRWDQAHVIQSRLATSWERINDTTMRFHLRKGVHFHSGNPMTSADVLWTFNRIQKSPDYKGIFAPFEKMVVIDDYTIDLVSKGPYPLVLNAATYIFPMDSKFYSGTDKNGQPKGQIKKFVATFASQNESGTGPFRVAQRQQGVKLIYERFKDYWDKQSPGNVDTIILTPIKENPTRVAALLSGDVDFIAPVPPTDLKRVNSNPKLDLITMSGARILTLQMNQERVKAFKDVRVRQAFVYAINNAAIVKKIMKGFGTTAAQLSPEGFLGHNDKLTPRYDLKKAKQLMKDAGYEKGFRISMLTPNNRYVNDAKIAQAVANMLAKINVTVDLKTIPKAQYWEEYDKRAADIMMIGWYPDTADSANYTEFLAACPNKKTGMGQYNSGNYCNPTIDGLLAKVAVESDTAKRTKMLQEIETILYEDAAYIPLHWENLSWAAKKNVKAKKVVNLADWPYLGDLVIE